MKAKKPHAAARGRINDHVYFPKITVLEKCELAAM